VAVKTFSYLAALLTLCGSVAAATDHDVIIADFEGDDYGDWVVTGQAFGQGPAHGPLGDQAQVKGFQGKGFVNTYHGGDPPEGIMTSPNLVIQRDYLNFLIGGGDTGETSFELISDGKIVRSITGQLFEIQAQIELAFAEETGLKVRGVDVVYHVKGQKVHCLGETAPLKMTDGSINLHLLADRTSLELFGNDGLLSMSSSMLPDDDNKSLAIFSRAGQIKYCELRFWEFKSIWNN
jgi:hypothetical protein